MSVTGRRRDIVRGLECVPVAAIVLAVRFRSIATSRVGAVRACDRMPVAGDRGTFPWRFPVKVGGALPAPVCRAELDRAFRLRADFRRDIRVCFGSVHGSYPAF